MNPPSPAPPHIFTLTGNLLAERTLEFDAWAPGRTQRARRETFQVGGKGINVAKMLTRLGTPSTALCFAGGATGTECEAWLAARRLPHRVFRTAAATRSGTVVRTSTSSPAATAPQPETTFLGPDSPPDAAAIRACADFLDAQPAGRFLAVCGSIPSWSHTDFDPLRAALLRCSRCLAARYCSRECQRSHWKAGHKQVCVPYTEWDGAPQGPTKRSAVGTNDSVPSV